MTRVVVVEDSKTQAFRLKSVLVKAGFSVELTSNGEAGLAACLAEPPDLVISDIVMPKMDGYALCRALRSNEATAKVPVLLLTSLAEPLDAVRALAAGADNFVSKPYEDGALLARVRRTLGGADDEPGPGVLELDGERFEITAPPRRVLQVLGSALEDAAVRAKENSRLLAEAEGVEVDPAALLAGADLAPELGAAIDIDALLAVYLAGDVVGVTRTFQQH